MGDLIKKTKTVPFINTGTSEAPVWTQIKKSTSFTLAMNPQTKTFDFISSETPQNEIDSYQPSLAQSLTMFKGEPDYEAIFEMLFNRATGAEAHRDALIVFYKEAASYTPAESETAQTVYKAWKIDALVTINQLDSVSENIDFDLALNEIEKGAVTVSAQGAPSFVAGTFSDDTFTPAASE
jgi:hypothetical protein